MRRLELPLQKVAHEPGGSLDGLGARELKFDQGGVSLAGSAAAAAVDVVVGSISEGKRSDGGVPLAEGGQNIGFLDCCCVGGGDCDLLRGRV